jgi:hypothetical protein
VKRAAGVFLVERPFAGEGRVRGPPAPRRCLSRTGVVHPAVSGIFSLGEGKMHHGCRDTATLQDGDTAAIEVLSGPWRSTRR